VVPPNARRAAWFRAGVGRVGWQHANDGGQPAEQAHAADRFALKIIAILTVVAVRSRRLMGRPLAHYQHQCYCALHHLGAFAYPL